MVFCIPFRFLFFKKKNKREKIKRKRKNRKLRKTEVFIAVSADMEVDVVLTNKALQPDARQEEDEGPHCEEKAARHFKPQLRSRQRPRQAKTFILRIRRDMPPSSS